MTKLHDEREADQQTIANLETVVHAYKRAAENAEQTTRELRKALEQAGRALEKGRIMALTPGLQTMIDWEVWLDTMVYPVLRSEALAAIAATEEGGSS